MSDTAPSRSVQDSGLARLLTPEEVGDLLGIPYRRLYAWKAEGKGPRYVQVGHNLRYRQSDVNDYIEENLIEPGAG